MVDISDVDILSDIQDAKNGNRKAAERVLGWTCSYLQKNEPLPICLRDYFLEAFNSVTSRKKTADNALHLKRDKKAKRADMGDKDKELKIALAVQDRVDDGYGLEESYYYVEDQYNFDLSAERIKIIYRKWREPIEEGRRFQEEKANR